MGTDTEAIRRQSALFILKMKEKRFLTQAAIDDMIDESTAIFDRTISMIKAGVREKMASSGVDVEIDDVYENLACPFDGLKTKYYQEKYFKEFMNLIVCHFALLQLIASYLFALWCVLLLFCYCCLLGVTLFSISTYYTPPLYFRNQKRLKLETHIAALNLLVQKDEELKNMTHIITFPS